MDAARRERPHIKSVTLWLSDGSAYEDLGPIPSWRPRRPLEPLPHRQPSPFGSTVQTFFWAFLALVILSTFWRKWRVFNVGRAALGAARTGDVAPVAAAIADLGPTMRADGFDRAVTDLWRAGHKPLAVRVIRAAAEVVGPTFTTQFWIRESLEHEPALAGELFDDFFMGAIYEPPVQQPCASYG